jgi:hypothetical protein
MVERLDNDFDPSPDQDLGDLLASKEISKEQATQIMANDCLFLVNGFTSPELTTALHNPNLELLDKPPLFLYEFNLKAQIRGIPTHQLAERLKVYSKAYLRWMVTKYKNPFLANGTGLEGYFIGDHLTSGIQVAREIGELGLQAMKNIAACDGKLMVRRIEKMVTNNVFDSKAMEIAQAEFAAILARLRTRLYDNHDATQYRETLDHTVSQLPPIHYGVDGANALEAINNGHFLCQQIFIPKNFGLINSHKYERLEGDPLSFLDPNLQRGFFYMDQFAKFGAPIPRVLSEF